MIVDDEPLLLGVLAKLLVGAGHEVVTAKDGFEGLTTFHRGTWDAVLTDHRMPRLGGEELADAIHAISPGTPIVLMTGFPGAVADPRRFQAVIGKPFNAAIVLDLLASLPARQSSPPIDH